MKKSKNNILHACLRHIGGTHSKKIVFIVDNINSDLTKIYFYELYIRVKIIKNSNTEPILEVTSKLSRLHMNL